MRYGGLRGFFPRITPAVKYLILLNSAAYICGLVLPVRLSLLLGLTPARFWEGLIWQPVTYMFLHGGIFHIFFNMIVLWMFGAALESTWGSRRFVLFYFICGIGAGLLNALVTPSSMVPIVGASGAIYGLLMAFAILFPNQLIYIWGILPVKAKYFVIVIGLIEFLTALAASQSGIAHVAHLGGMFFGLVYMKWSDWQGTVSAWRTQKRRDRHLKVVWDRDREKQKLQKEIDALLDKVGANGIGSLSPEEHERLTEASRKMDELENRG